MKKIALLFALTMQIVASAMACETTTGPLLAPVDPIAWGTVNADWGPLGNNDQMKSLRKIVNGQIAAHQVNCSYTCSSCRSVMRVKCFDPSNCVVCSKDAAEFASSVRTNIGNKNGNNQAAQKSMTAAAQHFLTRQEELRSELSASSKDAPKSDLAENSDLSAETTLKDKIANASDSERKKRSEAYRNAAMMLQMAASGQDQNAIAYFTNACNDVAGKLSKPEGSTALFAGSDPLN